MLDVEAMKRLVEVGVYNQEGFSTSFLFVKGGGLAHSGKGMDLWGTTIIA